MALGQGTELISASKSKILSIEELLKVFEQKTASAFKVSLLLGAIAAGADNSSIEKLEKFSLNIGIAYQIKDDISDFGSHFGDIEKRKISVLISLLFSSLSPGERKNLQNSLKTNDFENVYTQIEQFKLKDKAVILLIEYIRNAQESLKDLKNTALKFALHTILGRMFSDYI
jgi:geranylgeranyl pyrophosphate synthase